MIDTYPLKSNVIRTDSLIGCGNLLSFSEMLANNFTSQAQMPLSLMALDVNYFGKLNSEKGQAHGDATLRWIGIVLAEETNAQVYRIGGDEFVVALTESSHIEHTILAKRIFHRLNLEAKQFGLQEPAATVTVIHYSGEEQLTPADIFVQLYATFFDVKKDRAGSFKTYRATSIHPVEDTAYALWIANLMVERMVSLATMLDESHQLAYTDPVTGLPNLRAARDRLELGVAQAASTGKSFAILLIDGDDLRRYNQISYAAGDEMIQRLGATLNDKLRPGDFLARWRVGDEFLVILPETNPTQAITVGERLCRAVQQVSQHWPVPVTISIGVAACSAAGETGSVSVRNLLDQVEAANSHAKAMGKNRVVFAPDIPAKTADQGEAPL